MKTTRITYYIGLHAPRGENEPADVLARRTLALDSLASTYDALTVADVLGMWEGVEEPSLRVEAIGEDSPGERARARQLARTLREDLDQDAIGLTFEPVTFEII